jgi:hypothetical protein
MTSLAKDTRATVIPCIRYRDQPAAIEWLCQVFGFEKQMVVPKEIRILRQCWDKQAVSAMIPLCNIRRACLISLNYI